jgi:hypothetical protein
MRSATALIAIPMASAALLSGAIASSASAATGRLEIVAGSSVQIINDPVGCISVPLGSGNAQVTVINQTSGAVRLYTTAGCTGFGVSLASGQTATGAYASVLAP